jgi:choline-sulfatase
MRPTNLLIIMSDEHNQKVMGCAGHPIIRTPSLDALATRGTRFTSAYTTCPICVPARAAFALGKYIHQIGYWDNADAYEGVVPSWHHLLRAAGHRVVSIGKLHFRGRPGDDHGFSEEIAPMHIIEGIGDVKGLIRDDIPKRKGGEKMAKYAGPGETPYTIYDRDIASRAQIWLYEEAPKYRERPWVLFVSFVAPHFPLTAPPEFYYQYATRDLPLPKQFALNERPTHPYVMAYEDCVDYGAHFGDEATVKRALAGYFGLVSHVDDCIEQVLRALQATGLSDSTRVIYTSDHGDNNGARGLWGKSTLYEESAGVPLIVAGPEIPRGAICDAPASHVDCYPFIFDCVGASRPADPALPGVSLYELARGGRPDRAVVSEYHAIGSVAGAYMLRHGRWKYVHYCAYEPQLFDLEEDPEELVDRASDPAYRAVLEDCRKRLYAMLDPDAVDQRAKNRQGELLAEFGGREKALARGDLGFTPAPGTKPDMD